MRCSGRFTPGSDTRGRSDISNLRKELIHICVPSHLSTPCACKAERPFVRGKPNHTAPCLHPPGTSSLTWKTVTGFLLKVHKPWRLLPENAHGAHSFQLLPLAKGWDDEWKLSVMRCFCSRLRALPPWPQPTGNVSGSLGTPGCNWNKLVARWRNLRNLLLMIYFRVESLVWILKVVLKELWKGRKL